MAGRPSSGRAEFKCSKFLSEMPLAITFGICLTLLLPGGSSTSAGPANVISQDAQPQENPPSATDLAKFFSGCSAGPAKSVGAGDCAATKADHAALSSEGTARLDREGQLRTEENYWSYNKKNPPRAQSR